VLRQKTERDNPPVYFYNKSGEDRFIKIANSLVDFLINRLEMNKELFKKKIKMTTIIVKGVK